MLLVPTDTLANLDIRSAVENEVVRPREAIPKRVLEAALEGHIDEAARYLAGLFSRGLELGGADEIQATKGGRGLRALSILSFPERVLLEALTSRARELTSPIAREYPDWETFAAAPLEASGEAEYVVNADITAFYHYIDHELLEAELVSQTGEYETAVAITELLHGLLQRRFGLPQLYRGSDFLSEIVIDVMERRLIRKGLRVWRYNDDFRVAVSSWKDAQEAIEVLDREARSLGLTLNEEKTFAQTVDHYREWLAAPDTAWDQINEAVEFDFRRYNPYTGEVVASAQEEEEEEEEEEEGEEEGEEEDLEELEAAASRALEFWIELPLDGEDRIPARVYRRLLSRALLLLTQLGSEAGLEYVRRILAIEPQFAPAVSRYLSAATQSDSDAVAQTLDELVSDERLHLNAWQRLWLLGPAGALGPNLPDDLVAWVRICLREDQPGVLRSRAALTLSWYHEITPEDVILVFEQVPHASQPDAIAALVNAIGRSDSRVQAVARESPINRWIVNWAGG